MQRVVVVGAGLAGTHVAMALRRQGYEGEVVLVGAEEHPPYDRPPLSKAILLGNQDDSALTFKLDELRIDHRPSVRATALKDGGVETSAGDLGYDGLVLATGSEPIRLPGEGARYLRTKDDALELRAALRKGGRVVVVGAGWIGAEVATAAAKHGCQVTVVEQAATPVAHALPPEIATHLVPWYAQAGVELRTDTRVAQVGPDSVALVGGEELRADVVVVGVGVRPATAWLEGSEIPVDRGVLVGPDLATGVEGVYAVGDLVARWSARYGERIRGEHWDDALRAPAVVAANLLGGAEEYDPVPYVWSEQFGRMVQFAGHLGPEPKGKLVWRGDPAVDAHWSAFWLDARSCVTAVLAVDQPRDFVQGRRLAEGDVPIDLDKLADPAVAVKASVAESSS
jgi:3-phenylpropionate/trans-cinnamate dioxygenase ferredoxin reductase subunit